MKEDFKQAQEIADGIVEQIKIVDSELSEKTVLKLAIYTAERMRSVIPMYTGNINPKWKIYDRVTGILAERFMAHHSLNHPSQANPDNKL